MIKANNKHTGLVSVIRIVLVKIIIWLGIHEA